jgi:hypothetical protein
MKTKLKKYLLLVSILSMIILALGGNFPAGRAKAGEAKNSAAESLQGKEAVERLKEKGEYDSLAEAFRQSRINDGRTQNLTAVSQYRQQAQLTASDGASSDFFGNSVAVSIDTAIIGSSEDFVGGNTQQGSAYIFTRSGTIWTEQAHLFASDGANGDRFGTSVAISGTTVIVGAYHADVGVNPDQGAAYVFVKAQTGSSWTQQAKLTASDGASSDIFGYSVAINGSNVVVGAYLDDVGANSDQGSAYVFVRSGTIWTEEQHLFASDGTTASYFGESVAISGTTAIVGSYSREATYIFIRPTGNTWTQQQILHIPDGTGLDYFGISVGISGDTVIVGAKFNDIGSTNGQGSAYIFVRSGTTWTLQQKLYAPDGLPDENFGTSVAISANTAVVGTPYGKVNSNSSQGSAYVFARSGTTWAQQQKITAADGAPGDNFGIDVAISISTIVVGARGDNVGVNTDQGSAYVFNFSSVAAPFDFDGDGKTDLAIFRPAPGEWWINRSSNASTYAFQFGASTDKIVPADYTGDAKIDVAFWRPSTGQWFILRSEDSTFYGFPFGANGDVPVPADFDADGKADAAVFRPSTLTWYVNKSTGGTDITGFGAAGDKPVVADYDGDNKADIAIFRQGASGAEWWVRRSSNQSVFALQFGTSTDKPVEADYTGDGKADIAFWRPSTGEWFILRSENQNYYSFPFGANGDTPAPGDYDADGRADAAVFRPSSTNWFVSKSSGGTLIQQFGISGDIPVPNAFVP